MNLHFLFYFYFYNVVKIFVMEFSPPPFFGLRHVLMKCAFYFPKFIRASLYLIFVLIVL